MSCVTSEGFISLSGLVKWKQKSVSQSASCPRLQRVSWGEGEGNRCGLREDGSVSVSFPDCVLGDQRPSLFIVRLPPIPEHTT